MNNGVYGFAPVPQPNQTGGYNDRLSTPRNVLLASMYNSNSGTAPTTNSQELAVAIRYPFALQIFGILVDCYTAQTGAAVRVGLRAANPETGEPSILKVDGGELAFTGTGGKEATISPTEVGANELFYLVVKPNNSGSMASFRDVGGNNGNYANPYVGRGNAAPGWSTGLIGAGGSATIFIGATYTGELRYNFGPATLSNYQNHTFDFGLRARPIT